MLVTHVHTGPTNLSGLSLHKRICLACAYKLSHCFYQKRWVICALHEIETERRKLCRLSFNAGKGRWKSVCECVWVSRAECWVKQREGETLSWPADVTHEASRALPFWPPTSCACPRRLKAKFSSVPREQVRFHSSSRNSAYVEMRFCSYVYAPARIWSRNVTIPEFWYQHQWNPSIFSTWFETAADT